MSSSTGSATDGTERMPRVVSPRSCRARRTRCTLSASCGATDTETTTADPISCRADGSERSSRLGLASALAAPMQAMITASRRPSTAAPISPSR